MPIPIVAGLWGGLVALANSLIVKSLIDRVLFFLAIKAVLTALFVVVAPIILNNVIYDLMEIGLNMVDGQAAGVEVYDGSMHFTGILGWFLDCLAIPGVIGILTSAFQLHLLLKMIPFSPVK